MDLWKDNGAVGVSLHNAIGVPPYTDNYVSYVPQGMNRIYPEGYDENGENIHPTVDPGYVVYVKGN
jgi:hypothetical protein